MRLLAGTLSECPRLHRLRLGKPTKQLRVHVLERADLHVMAHATRSDTLPARDAFVDDLVIEDEADS